MAATECPKQYLHSYALRWRIPGVTRALLALLCLTSGDICVDGGNESLQRARVLVARRGKTYGQDGC